MQIPEYGEIKRENNGLLKYLKSNEVPLGIEGFITSKEPSSIRNVFKIETPVRFAEEKDIPELFEVNQQVYKGYYPYRDMLNVQYVQEFTDPQKNHGFIGVYDTEDHKTIGGFLLMAVDNSERKGNFRGLMVRPKHQHRLDLKNRVFETVYHGYKTYYNNVDLWYGETRTAHSKGQKWMEETGSRPYAFFPNKDIFTEDLHRESDILQIAYTKDALQKKRTVSPKVLQHFEPIFEFIRKNLLLPEIKPEIASQNISRSIFSEARQLAEKCTVQKLPGLYDTYSCKIQTPKGSSLQFVVNTQIRSAEKTVFSASSPEELITLLFQLKNFIEKENLEYFEVFVPTTTLYYQEILKQMKFSCFGYVPSWKWSQNKLHDCLVFGFYKQPINWERTILTPKSKSFVDIIRPFLNKEENFHLNPDSAEH